MVKDLIAAADTAFGGKNTDGFRAFLTQPNKDQFSPLNSAACAGHLEVVKDLIAAADTAFGGKNTDGFRAFLTHKDKDQFSPLNTASKEGHLEVVKDLIAAADTAFGGKDSSQFNAFLEQINNHGFTPLNAAANSAKQRRNTTTLFSSICTILLSKGADPDKKNKRGFSARQNWRAFSWPDQSRQPLINNQYTNPNNRVLKLNSGAHQSNNSSTFFKRGHTNTNYGNRCSTGRQNYVRYTKNS